MIDIQRLAREAGLCMANDEWPLMERFAALCREADGERIKKLEQALDGALKSLENQYETDAWARAEATQILKEVRSD